MVINDVVIMGYLCVTYGGARGSYGLFWWRPADGGVVCMEKMCAAHEEAR